MKDLVWKGIKLDKTKTLDELGIKNNNILICYGCSSNKEKIDDKFLSESYLKYYEENGMNDGTIGFCMDDLINKIISSDLVQDFKKELYTKIKKKQQIQQQQIQQIQQQQQQQIQKELYNTKNEIVNEQSSLVPIKVGGGKKLNYTKKKKSKRKKKKNTKRKKKTRKRKLLGGAGDAAPPLSSESVDQFSHGLITELKNINYPSGPELGPSFKPITYQGGTVVEDTLTMYIYEHLLCDPDILQNILSIIDRNPETGEYRSDTERMDRLIAIITQKREDTGDERVKGQLIIIIDNLTKAPRPLAAIKFLKIIVNARDKVLLILNIIWWLWTMSQGLFIHINRILRSTSHLDKDVVVFPYLSKVLDLITTTNAYDTKLVDAPGGPRLGNSRVNEPLYRAMYTVQGDWVRKPPGLLHFNHKWKLRRQCQNIESDNFVLFEPSYMATSSNKVSAVEMFATWQHTTGLSIKEKILFRILGTIEIDEDFVEKKKYEIKTSSPLFQQYSTYSSEEEFLLKRRQYYVTDCISTDDSVPPLGHPDQRGGVRVKWKEEQTNTGSQGEWQYTRYDVYVLEEEHFLKYALKKVIDRMIQEFNPDSLFYSFSPSTTSKGRHAFERAMKDMFKANMENWDFILKKILEGAGHSHFMNDLASTIYVGAEKSAIQRDIPILQTSQIKLNHESKFMESCITLNAHGSYNAETIPVPEGIEVLIPHRDGTEQGYTVENLPTSYEEIFYNRGILNFQELKPGEQKPSNSGWKLYKSGESINNMLFSHLGTLPCNALPPIQTSLIIAQTMVNSKWNPGRQPFTATDTSSSKALLNYALVNGRPIVAEDTSKLKIKICKDIDLKTIMQSLNERLKTIHRVETLSGSSPNGTDLPTRLIIYACNAKHHRTPAPHGNITLSVADDPLFDETTLFDVYLKLNTEAQTKMNEEITSDALEQLGKIPKAQVESSYDPGVSFHVSQLSYGSEPEPEPEPEPLTDYQPHFVELLDDHGNPTGLWVESSYDPGVSFHVSQLSYGSEPEPEPEPELPPPIVGGTPDTDSGSDGFLSAENEESASTQPVPSSATMFTPPAVADTKIELWDDLEKFPGQYEKLRQKWGNGFLFVSARDWRSGWKHAQPRTRSGWIKKYQIPKPNI